MRRFCRRAGHTCGRTSSKEQRYGWAADGHGHAWTLDERESSEKITLRWSQCTKCRRFQPHIGIEGQTVSVAFPAYFTPKDVTNSYFTSTIPIPTEVTEILPLW